MPLNDRPVLDLLTMFDDGPKKGFLTRLCYYCFVAAENDMNAQYPQIPHLKKQVMSSERVHRSIQATMFLSENNPDNNVEQDVNLENALKSKALEFANEMIGTITSRVIRFCGWIYLTLLKQVCSSVQFSPEQMQSIQEVSNSSTPLIYMPLHFSHLDYILVSLILFHNKIRCPFIASGNNLHIPFFGYFIKRAGGFFIRRKLDGDNRKDLIYRAVLHTYVTELLKHGQSIEIFLEGTRSRSGLPNLPKTGLLSLLVDAVVEGQVPDALLVPVSISYEKLFEGNFNCELIGKPKLKENLWNTIKSITNMLCGRYGNIKINFGKPLSMKTALCDICMYSCKNPTVGSPFSPLPLIDDNSNKSKSSQKDAAWRRNISLLAEHVIYGGLKCRSFMSTNLVAFLLINRWRNGIQLSDLVASFLHLRAELASRGRDVGFSGSSHDVVLHALSILGNKVLHLECLTEYTLEPVKSSSTINLGGAGDASCMIIDTKPKATPQQSPEHKNGSPSLFIKPNLSIPEIFELVYYSNSLAPVFALESLVCLSIVAVTGFRFSTISRQWEKNCTDIYEDSLPESVRISFLKSKLIDKAVELSDILQVDLILCDVSEDLENCIKETVHDLISSGCLMSETFGNNKNTPIAYGLDEEENCSDDQWLKVNLSSLSQIICYQSVLAPILEGMAVVTEQIKVLDEPVTEKQFLTRLIDVACERSTNDLATRVECCSKDILNHCIYALKCNKVLEVREGQLALCRELSTPNSLNHLLSKICQYNM